MAKSAPRNTNKVILTGNLVKDPELRQAGEKSVCGLRMAVNNGGPVDAPYPTLFIDVDVWNGAGEACANYLSKGRSVLVSGRLDIQPFEKKDGTKGISVKVIADGVEFLGGPKQDPSDGAESAPAAGSDEDIPF